MWTDAPLSEKTAARRQDSEQKGGLLSGSLLGQQEEGEIAVEAPLAVGADGLSRAAGQLAQSLSVVLCGLVANLCSFVWL